MYYYVCYLQNTFWVTFGKSKLSITLNIHNIIQINTKSTVSNKDLLRVLRIINITEKHREENIFEQII